MNFSRSLFVALLMALLVPTLRAQNSVGPLALDPTFAIGGKAEVGFPVDSTIVTCYVAYKPIYNGQLDRILVAGKVYSGGIGFAIAEYDSNGVPEVGFGVSGVSRLNFDGIDYPNAINLLPDGRILAAGATDLAEQHIHPAIFRLNPDGALDSSLGGGQFHGLLFSTFLEGEFEDIDSTRIGSGDTSLRFVASGYEGAIGFYAVRMSPSGVGDSSFGALGEASINARLFYAEGHLVAGNQILFAGVSDTGTNPLLLLGKLRSNGTPDSSFGTNGVLNTGILVPNPEVVVTPISSLYDPDSVPSDPYRSLIVCVPANRNEPFTVLKFKLNGTLDSNFGVNGSASSQSLSNMTARGITLSNDGSILVAGNVGNVSAAAKFFLTGKLDTTFGTGGLALLDADGGTAWNYLIGFVPVPLPPPHPNGGGQRFVGVGESSGTGSKGFLVARYLPAKNGVSTSATNAASFDLYPNPAKHFVALSAIDGTIQSLSITDVLGRTIQSFERPSFAASSNSYLLDVSSIPDGAYNCAVRTSAGVFSARFTVIH